MAAPATCGIVVIVVLLAFLANFSASFVYFLTPVDVANHYSCAINSSLSPRSLSHLTSNILQLGDITKNYTGNVDALTDKLPTAILQKMRECEAFHGHIHPQTSSPAPSSISAGGGTPDDEHIEHLLAQMVHCYKETDLMYFKTLRFEEEPQERIDDFHKCLRNVILPFQES